MLLNVVGFLIILGPLVVVHEFGHYFFARLFGVKAEVFSIGFGKKMWSKQLGETELRVAWLPLGGFVKLLGEDREAPLSPEESKRALHRQAAWKRFFIFFGGPLFNFLFAILVFMAILAIGEPQISNLVGRVVKDSPAAKAGFMSGDRIVSVEGQSVKRFEEIANIMADHPGAQLRFEVIHPGAARSIEIGATTTSEEGYSLYGEQTRVGEVEGLLPSPRAPLVGVADPNSVAARAGIRTGDNLLELNGQPVKNFEDFEAAYEALPAKSAVGLKFERPDHSSYQTVLSKPASHLDMSQAWGLDSSEMYIDKVVPDSPAAKAGLVSGDRILTVSHHAIQSFFDLKDEVQKAGETQDKVELQWEHQGKVISASIKPSETSSRNALLKKSVAYTVGIVPMLTMIEPEMTIERIWNPAMLLYKGTGRMIEFSWRNLVSIEKMVIGDVSVATLGGPIMIGKLAGESLAHGLVPFLTMMAILSIGLGVLNVLPIPVLDGGHLMLLAIESVRGKPLTLRTMEIIQSVGLTAILALMFLVMKNDLVRVFF
jgi:regulator of sigma E protease